MSRDNFAQLKYRDRGRRHDEVVARFDQYVQVLHPMKPSERLNAHREAIRAIVAAHRATNPRVFGSVARGEDTEDSDIDILIDPVGAMSLFDIGGIQFGLSQLLGARVDVVTPDALPDRVRSNVLAEALQI